MGCLVALLILANGYVKEEGLGGPCYIGSEWAPGYPEATKLVVDDQLWPPGERCSAFSASGRPLGSRVYPGAHDWALAAVGLAAPFVLLGGYRILRRRAGFSPPTAGK
jgi:hypothetical protein